MNVRFLYSWLRLVRIGAMGSGVAGLRNPSDRHAFCRNKPMRPELNLTRQRNERICDGPRQVP
jgi:hypothetical protein